MPKHPYLKRSGPRGMWCYRRAVPARLRPIIGKREILMSFDTSVLSEALIAYPYYAADAQQELDLAQEEYDYRQAEGAGPPTIINHLFDPTTPQQRCRTHYQACKQAEVDFRNATTKEVASNPAAFWRGEFLPLPMSQDAFYQLPGFGYMRESQEGFKIALGMAYRFRLEQRQTVLKAMLLTQDFAALGAAVGCCADCAKGMGAAFARTELSLIHDLLADDAALVPNVIEVGSPLEATGIVPIQSAPAVSTVPVLSAVMTAWIGSNTRGSARWSQERAALCLGVLQDFLQVCGDRPINDYARRDGRAFMDLLRRLPANLHKLKSKLGLKGRDLEASAVAAAAHGLPPQDDATVNKKIGIVQQFFAWSMQNYDECTRNPLEGMRVQVARKARDQKLPFTLEQLSNLFRAPVYTGCQSEVRWSVPGDTVLRHSPKFWVPLIALYTGMRLGEICQLAQRNYVVRGDCHAFILTQDMRLKNDASIRCVPIHRDLLAFGLPAFMESCQERLFPDLTEHSSGRYSDAFGKHFARFLKGLDIKSERVDFHSLRHNFAAAAEASGMEFTARERILGHALQGQAARYGNRYTVEAENAQLVLTRDSEMQKLRFAGLNLDHLRAAVS